MSAGRDPKRKHTKTWVDLVKKSWPPPARGYTPDPAVTGQRFTPDGMGGGLLRITTPTGRILIVRKEPHLAT